MIVPGNRQIVVKITEKVNFEAIVELGKERGHLTYDESNERLPENITAEELEELFVELEALNITISADMSVCGVSAAIATA